MGSVTEGYAINLHPLDNALSLNSFSSHKTVYGQAQTVHRTDTIGGSNCIWSRNIRWSDDSIVFVQPGRRRPATSLVRCSTSQGKIRLDAFALRVQRADTYLRQTWSSGYGSKKDEYLIVIVREIWFLVSHCVWYAVLETVRKVQVFRSQFAWHKIHSTELIMAVAPVVATQFACRPTLRLCPKCLW